MSCNGWTPPGNAEIFFAKMCYVPLRQILRVLKYERGSPEYWKWCRTTHMVFQRGLGTVVPRWRRPSSSAAYGFAHITCVTRGCIHPGTLSPCQKTWRGGEDYLAAVSFCFLALLTYVQADPAQKTAPLCTPSNGKHNDNISVKVTCVYVYEYTAACDAAGFYWRTSVTYVQAGGIGKMGLAKFNDMSCLLTLVIVCLLSDRKIK